MHQRRILAERRFPGSYVKRQLKCSLDLCTSPQSE